ncbi:hypothetical protein [Pectobacterium versatile]|uniref:hypothetical protein n=1 Tax=Pectobacterium versatile TaxID=2488639 RepID=UPI0030180A19
MSNNTPYDTLIRKAKDELYDAEQDLINKKEIAYQEYLKTTDYRDDETISLYSEACTEREQAKERHFEAKNKLIQIEFQKEEYEHKKQERGYNKVRVFNDTLIKIAAIYGVIQFIENYL